MIHKLAIIIKNAHFKLTAEIALMFEEGVGYKIFDMFFAMYMVANIICSIRGIHSGRMKCLEGQERKWMEGRGVTWSRSFANTGGVTYNTEYRSRSVTVFQETRRPNPN